MYPSGTDGLVNTPNSRINAIIIAIIDKSGPITFDDIYTMIIKAWGARKGNKSYYHIKSIISKAVTNRSIEEFEGFYWPKDNAKDKIYISSQGVHQRNIQQIPMQEIKVALIRIVQASMSIDEVDLYKEFRKLFALQPTADVSSSYHNSIQQLLSEGVLRLQNSRIVCTSDLQARFGTGEIFRINQFPNNSLPLEKINQNESTQLLDYGKTETPLPKEDNQKSEQKECEKQILDTSNKNISVSSIKSREFKERIDITHVTIKESVTTIPELAFYLCSNLSYVYIPNSVTLIRDFSFRGCTSLSSITIPGSVRSIGVGAFSECKSLENLVIENLDTKISISTFADCPGFRKYYFSYLPSFEKEFISASDLGKEKLIDYLAEYLHLGSTDVFNYYLAKHSYEYAVKWLKSPKHHETLLYMIDSVLKVSNKDYLLELSQKLGYDNITSAIINKSKSRKV